MFCLFPQKGRVNPTLPTLRCWLLFALSSSAFGAAVDSSIRSVTVYTDRAVVTRTAVLSVSKAGSAEAVFERLPPSLFANSLQVSGRGSADITILDVTARDVYVPFAASERARDLENRIGEEKSQQRLIEDQGKALKDEAEALTRIELAATPVPTKDAPHFSLDDGDKLLSYLAEHRRKLAADQRAVDEQDEQLAAKIAALQRQLAELQGTTSGRNGRSYKEVTVRLSAAAADSVALELSYAVPNASWTPSYDARVGSAEHAVQLAYSGLVRQNSGEDWTGVELALSTAKPALGGAAPALEPWPLDVISPLRFNGRASAERSEEVVQLSPFEVRAGGSTLQFARGTQLAAKFSQAEIETALTSASFKIPVKATVHSDNSPEKVPITSLRLESASEYRSVPKDLEAAFLMGKVSNTSQFPLLAGEMNVFLDGTFVASSRLATVMPGEEFDLPLGADEGIAVKRTLDRRFTESLGLMTKKTRTTYEFTLSVQNNKQAAEAVVVIDQVPVSRNEKIVVRLLAPTEGEAKPDPDGTLRWTFSLKPGEKREWPLRFTVEYPTGTAVSGLD
jgi:uncharacterized protein (TIGR02231 family)